MAKPLPEQPRMLPESEDAYPDFKKVDDANKARQAANQNPGSPV